MRAVTIHTEPLAVSIAEAARIVGLSRSQFYREYLNTELVKPIPKGRGRRRVLIDLKELTCAYEERKAAQRASVSEP